MIKVTAASKQDEPRAQILQFLANDFWDNGGKEKYEQTKEVRDANGIPDSQWVSANLMSMIDDAKFDVDKE